MKSATDKRERARQYYRENREKICDYHKQRRRERNARLGRETRIGKAPKPASQRIWKFVKKTETCWVWTGAIAGGYAHISVNSKPQRAHRVMYELLVGPIPEGMELDHVRSRGCTMSHCVNPAHLEPVTHKENMKRARRSLCKRGHEYNETNTRYYHNAKGQPRKACRPCDRIRHR